MQSCACGHFWLRRVPNFYPVETVFSRSRNPNLVFSLGDLSDTLRAKSRFLISSRSPVLVCLPIFSMHRYLALNHDFRGPRSYVLVFHQQSHGVSKAQRPLSNNSRNQGDISPRVAVPVISATPLKFSIRKGAAKLLSLVLDYFAFDS